MCVDHIGWLIECKDKYFPDFQQYSLHMQESYNYHLLQHEWKRRFLIDEGFHRSIHYLPAPGKLFCVGYRQKIITGLHFYWLSIIISLQNGCLTCRWHECLQENYNQDHRANQLYEDSQIAIPYCRVY